MTAAEVDRLLSIVDIGLCTVDLVLVTILLVGRRVIARRASPPRTITTYRRTRRARWRKAT